MGITPIIMCFELNTFLGSGMIFACGTIYGFMALGKKVNILEQLNLCVVRYIQNAHIIKADRGTMMAAGDPAWSPQVNQPSVS
ncbi:hypothetical protein Y032_0121g1020 [Ancylostoma ceylanicum]|uniref:Uncharacterized protein n=1 Tax=Ancylostoma ceylanicum TaxID=53326 RepID=A0A016TA68_9BILA|nr:hypothetical protein Y032_0121g1020 [Ancylostoma ceylanicum]